MTLKEKYSNCARHIATGAESSHGLAVAATLLVLSFACKQSDISIRLADARPFTAAGKLRPVYGHCCRYRVTTSTKLYHCEANLAFHLPQTFDPAGLRAPEDLACMKRLEIRWLYGNVAGVCIDR